MTWACGIAMLPVAREYPCVFFDHLYEQLFSERVTLWFPALQCEYLVISCVQWRSHFQADQI